MLTALAEGWEGLILKQMLELSWLLPRAPEHLVAFSHSESPDSATDLDPANAIANSFTVWEVCTLKCKHFDHGSSYTKAEWWVGYAPMWHPSNLLGWQQSPVQQIPSAYA